MVIRRFDSSDIHRHLDDLCELLIDTVASGASVGFLPPLAPDVAETYWRSVAASLDNRILLAACSDAGRVSGSVQLALEDRANGAHRAEVAKLMVHRSARRAGLGRALMLALEEEARAAGRSTLVLDTREGDPSESLYLQLGYVKAGAIPQYARSADGHLHTTAFLYKLL